MKCKACDALLNDNETKKKDAMGRYLDLCGSCFQVSLQTVIEAVDDSYSDGKRCFNGGTSTKS